jgi:hypothetical protein
VDGSANISSRASLRSYELSQPGRILEQAIHGFTLGPGCCGAVSTARAHRFRLRQENHRMLQWCAATSIVELSSCSTRRGTPHPSSARPQCTSGWGLSLIREVRMVSYGFQHGSGCGVDPPRP